MFIHNVNLNLDLLGVVQDLTTIVSVLAQEMEHAERDQDRAAWERIHRRAQLAKRRCRELVEVLQPGNPVRLNLSQCVLGACEGVMEGVPPHIRVCLGELDPTVFIKAAQTTIPRVLHNLIDHAVGILGDQSGSVVLEVSRVDKYAVVSVADCGPGLEDHVIEKMFDSGFSVASAGLACVLHLANRYGGCLRVASQPGVGTRVDFLLPSA